MKPEASSCPAIDDGKLSCLVDYVAIVRPLVVGILLTMIDTHLRRLRWGANSPPFKASPNFRLH